MPSTFREARNAATRKWWHSLPEAERKIKSLKGYILKRKKLGKCVTSSEQKLEDLLEQDNSNDDALDAKAEEVWQKFTGGSR